MRAILLLGLGLTLSTAAQAELKIFYYCDYSPPIPGMAQKDLHHQNFLDQLRTFRATLSACRAGESPDARRARLQSDYSYLIASSQVAIRDIRHARYEPAVLDDTKCAAQLEVTLIGTQQKVEDINRNYSQQLGRPCALQ